MSLFRTRKAE